jgi:PAS domain S-box-containing protein
MEEIASFSELLGCGLLLFDEEMKVCHANAAAGEILDIPPEVLCALPLDALDAMFMDLQGKPVHEERRPLRQAVSREKRVLGAELTLARKNASHIRISLNATPLFDNDGRPRGLVADFTRCCRSEERLHQFIGAMDEIVFELDAQGRYINIWTENEELLKAPGRELFGRRFEEFIPKELAHIAYDVFRQVRATGSPTTFEYPLEVLGGARWFLARVALVPPSGDGEPTFSFLARDITEQKQLEQNLRKSERRFRGLFENAAAGIALVDLEGRCLETNQCLRDMLGYSAEELLREPFSAYSHSEDLPLDLEQFERMVRGEIESYRMEKRLIRKDRSEIWAHLTASLQRDEQGSPLYCIGIVVNITRRKLIEAERELLLGELEAIFASAGDGIIFYDEKGNILRLNEAAKEILGYSNDQIKSSLDERYRQWAPKRPDGTVLPLEESALHRVFQGEPTKGTTAQFRRLDGKQVWISFSASPVLDSSGRQIGAVSTLSDITAERELQERLEDYLHMMAHDLRSPLTVISGYAEILEEMLGDTHREALAGTQAIVNAADHMNSMMEDLIEAGRLESGQAALNHDVIDLHDFIADFLRRQISKDYQRVRTEIPQDLPPARIGKNHLERIMVNLIGNALKYSTPDQPVEIRSAREEGKVCLSVKDYGQGIAPEDLPRIFERFYRTPSARSKTSGTGMGLYITKKLLESYGGTIRVESEVGHGSTFTLCIPEFRA